MLSGDLSADTSTSLGLDQSYFRADRFVRIPRRYIFCCAKISCLLTSPTSGFKLLAKRVFHSLFFPPFVSGAFALRKSGWLSIEFLGKRRGSERKFGEVSEGFGENGDDTYESL